jgi:DMSO reductase anchor subunit
MKKVDTTTIKFNQASIITLTLLGFLLNQPYLVLFVGLVLAIGTILPRAALFMLIYLKLLKPNNILKANVIDDDPAPHQFAQGVGALFLLAGSVALLVFKAAILGWTLAWIVIVLAAINLFFGFCAGCFVYYQLDKVGLLPKFGRG